MEDLSLNYYQSSDGSLSTLRWNLKKFMYPEQKAKISATRNSSKQGFKKKFSNGSHVCQKCYKVVHSAQYFFVLLDMLLDKSSPSKMAFQIDD